MSSDYPDIRELSIAERLVKERRFSYLTRFENVLTRFSPAERLILYGLSIALAASTLLMVVGVSRMFSDIVPARGGALTEGEVGPVRFINPILATSQADGDLTELVYSGLMRARADGSYIPDLAASYTISPDGTSYTFKIRDDATFQDGTPVTSADVLFTIQLAQNPDIKSPQQADWQGVSVSAPDTRTIVFTLPHAYAPFMQNTTLGILPAHVWQNVSPEEFPFSPLNTHPIGSGPYRVTGFKTDSTGSATRYDLAPFEKFTLGEPYLSRLTFLFYPSSDALTQAFNEGSINAMAGISPSVLPQLQQEHETLLRSPLPRTFGIFFNQNHDVTFTDASVRAALTAAIDKNVLVGSVLGGYGTALDSPIPPGVLGEAPQTTSVSLPIPASATTTVVVPENVSDAQALLRDGGWTYDNLSNTWSKKKQVLGFTLSTADEPELVATANAAAAAWRAVGVQVTVQVYPLSEFNNTVLRPRAYDAILFGQVVGRTADLFAFWDSSQRNDPGLNLAMYANANVDSLLSQARATSDSDARDTLYQSFAQQVKKDQPAVFLYAPDFLYAVPSDLHGVELGALQNAPERFLNVYEWYTTTARVWDVFVPSNPQ